MVSAVSTELRIYIMLALDHVIFSLQRAGGISRWWVELVTRLGDVLPRGILHIGPYRNSNCVLAESSLSLEIENTRRLYPVELYARVRLPSSVKVFHSSYFRLCERSKSTALVTTFHDSALLFGSGLRAVARRYLIGRAVREADLVHCVSAASAFQLQEAFPDVPAARIRVVHHGVTRWPPQRIARLKLTTGAFVLWVGKRRGYKNGLICYDALRRLPDLDIVFVGGEPPSAPELRLATALGIANRVHYLGDISSAELAWAYTNAIALWYTSLIEGFGLPLIEAAAYGCPAITSGAEAVREVAGNWATMSEMPTAEWLAASTVRLSDVSTRRVLAEQGAELAQRYSWNACVRGMLHLYAELHPTGMPDVDLVNGGH